MMLVGAYLIALVQAGSLPVQQAVPDQSRASESKVATKPAPRASGVRKGPYRVIVDAGHGGVDPGAPMQGGGNEKDITLQLSLRVGAALKARNIEVTYTRTRDTLIARADRGRIANEASGDVFLSIHVNAANPGWKQPQAARGFETYFLGVANTEDTRRVEEMEEASAKFETGPRESGGDPLAFILTDMIQNEHLRESADLAEIVQRHLGKIHPGPNRGVKQANFTVLISAFMPAVLVEVGFGTNREEARFLASTSKQVALANAIAEATREYLLRHDARIGSTKSQRTTGASSGRYD